MAGGARIPSSSPRPCRSHIDTSYLLPLLLGRDPDSSSEANPREIFERVDTLSRAGHGTPLGTSLIAIGEAFSKISGNPEEFRSSWPENPPSQRLASLVQEHRLQVCWAGHEGQRGGAGLLRLAARVLDLEPGVGVADSLIVACAVACRTTLTLYTTDARLIRSPGLRALGRTGGRQWNIAEVP